MKTSRLLYLAFLRRKLPRDFRHDGGVHHAGGAQHGEVSADRGAQRSPVSKRRRWFSWCSFSAPVIFAFNINAGA
jgi:hypothetical protein